MISILLLLAALPVRGRILNPIDYSTDRSGTVLEESEPEAFGAATMRAVFMKPAKMASSDLAKMMMNEMEIIKDSFGPAVDRPIGEMVDTLMHSTPEEMLHGIIDPIMSSPKSQETLGDLDRQLAEFITSQLGDGLLDNEFLGGNTVSALLDYATGQLPRITAFQFAVQLMFQFQIKFASMMDVMTTTTFGELIEPISNIFAQIPRVTPSEAAQMLAELIIRNDVNLGSLDEVMADFIKGMQTPPTGSSRPVNGQDSGNSDINRPSSDNFNREQADFSRLGNGTQNTNYNGQAFANQGFPDQGSSEFQGHPSQQGTTGQQTDQGSVGFRGRPGLQGSTGQQTSDNGSGGPNQSGNQVTGGSNTNTHRSSESGGSRDSSNQNEGQYDYAEPEQVFKMRQG